MEEPLTKLRETLAERKRLPFFQDLADYIQTLRPGDRLIFAILGLFVVLSSTASVLALEQRLLVVEPAYGGSLSEGTVTAPRFINPLLALSDTDQDLTSLTYAGLMGIGSNGSLIPVLAQSYRVSPDGRTYQFTLRDNLRFSDHTPITADDVVFTIQKAKDPGLKSPEAVNWSKVTVSALDSRTVQFTLTAPYAQFLYSTTLGILPAHLWRNVTNEEFPFSSLETRPVGEGPFLTSQINQDGKGNITQYTITANPDYALGRPYLDTLLFSFYADQNALQTALTKHQVDSAYGVTSDHMVTAPYSRVFAVFFNAGTPKSPTLFSAKAVRQALSLAINRNEIVSKVFGNYATPLSGPVPAGSGIAPLTSTSTSSTTDGLTAASTALTAGGWVYSSTNNTWINATGATLSTTLKTSDVPELKVLAQTIQSEWQALHIPTTLQYYQPGDLTQQVIRPRAYQALLFGMVIGKGDDLYDFWDSANSADPGLNITNYSNPTVDKLLSDLRTQADPKIRNQDLSQVNSLIAADYPAAFIESPDFVYAVPNDLKGVILSQITSPSDRFATVATWYRRTESVWPFLARTNR